MSKPLRYRLYSGDLPTVHESNTLEDLVALGELLGGAQGKTYTVRDLSGTMLETVGKATVSCGRRNDND